MRAAAFTEFGGPEVLRLTELPDPKPGPGEVRVQVRAAGVQPADVAVRQGWGPPGATVSFPQIPGNEFAGVVDLVGEGVTGWAPGDDVLGFTTLTAYAELVVVPADQLVRKPQAMPWEVAGSLSASGQTAHRALRLLEVGKGDTVLIHAAAGGVGSIAVQLARLAGASVVGTASPANHDYLRELGAIPVTYGDGLVDRVRELAPDGVDAAIDAAGGDALRTSVELVGNRDRIGTLVAMDLADKLGVRKLRGDRTSARLGELVSLWEQGKLAVHVRATYPLERAADAQRDVATGHGRGKVVLLV